MAQESAVAQQAAQSVSREPQMQAAMRVVANGVAEIELDANGPKLEAFRSFDLPFLAALWLCVDPAEVKKALGTKELSSSEALQKLEALLRQGVHNTRKEQPHDTKTPRDVCRDALITGKPMWSSGESRVPIAFSNVDEKGSALRVEVLRRNDTTSCTVQPFGLMSEQDFEALPHLRARRDGIPLSEEEEQERRKLQERADNAAQNEVVPRQVVEVHHTIREL